MTAVEAQHHLENYLPVPPGRRLPDGWHTNLDNVPVAPPLTGQARLDYITVLWQTEVDGVTKEGRRQLLPFNVTAAYWDVMVEDEHQGPLHSFRPTG